MADAIKLPERVAERLLTTHPRHLGPGIPASSEAVQYLSKRCGTIAPGAENLAEVGPIWSIFGDVGPDFADWRRVWPTFGRVRQNTHQSWLSLGQVWPNLAMGRTGEFFAERCRGLANCGKARPNLGPPTILGRNRQTNDHIWPASNQHRSESRRPGQSIGNVGTAAGPPRRLLGLLGVAFRDEWRPIVPQLRGGLVVSAMVGI